MMSDELKAYRMAQPQIYVLHDHIVAVRGIMSDGRSMKAELVPEDGFKAADMVEGLRRQAKQTGEVIVATRENPHRELHEFGAERMASGTFHAMGKADVEPQKGLSALATRLRGDMGRRKAEWHAERAQLVENFEFGPRQADGIDRSNASRARQERDEAGRAMVAQVLKGPSHARVDAVQGFGRKGAAAER